MHILTCECACHVLEVMARDRLRKAGERLWEQHGTVELCQRSPLYVGFVCGEVRRSDGDAGAARAGLLLRRLPRGAVLLGRLRLGRALRRHSAIR